MSENGKSTATSIDLAGTYLEEMARILNTGDFIPAPEEQVADGEIVIGEMNALEKACHSAARRFGERADEMTNESMATANSEEEMVSTQKASARRFNIFKAMSEMKWASITARLGEACTEGRGIAIRSGYKIVS
ncbi:MAG TPA: hypothetical protein VN437_02465, partial [Rectinemataceae bacterium]|nr:hypothetical protein [Rectinemataceae bacterium]